MRISKNVKKTAIRISDPAATDSDEVATSYSFNAEVASLEHKTNTYHEKSVTEHSKLDSMYAGGE